MGRIKSRNEKQVLCLQMDNNTTSGQKTDNWWGTKEYNIYIKK